MVCNNLKTGKSAKKIKKICIKNFQVPVAKFFKLS